MGSERGELEKTFSILIVLEGLAKQRISLIRHVNDEWPVEEVDDVGDVSNENHRRAREKSILKMVPVLGTVIDR